MKETNPKYDFEKKSPPKFLQKIFIIHDDLLEKMKDTKKMKGLVKRLAPYFLFLSFILYFSVNYYFEKEFDYRVELWEETYVVKEGRTPISKEFYKDLDLGVFYSFNQEELMVQLIGLKELEHLEKTAEAYAVKKETDELIQVKGKDTKLLKDLILEQNETKKLKQEKELVFKGDSVSYGKLKYQIMPPLKARYAKHLKGEVKKLGYDNKQLELAKVLPISEEKVAFYFKPHHKKDKFVYLVEVVNFKEETADFYRLTARDGKYQFGNEYNKE